MTQTGAKSRRGEGSVWLSLFVVGLLLCVAAFAINLFVAEVEPAGAWGLAYGAGAVALLLGCAAYGLRRRSIRVATRLGLGRARSWLYFHTYAGLLFLLLVLMHSGFGLPSGWVTWGLWTLSLWVAASGVVGLALQRWIPRRLTSGLSIEVNYERIPELVAEAGARAENLVEDCGESVRAFYERSVRGVFAGPHRSWLYLVDITGGRRRRLREFSYLAERLSAEEREKLQRLEQLYASKLDMDAHYTLQRVLRVWLWTHLPLSIALVALLAVHLFSVFYY